MNSLTPTTHVMWGGRLGDSKSCTLTYAPSRSNIVHEDRAEILIAEELERRKHTYFKDEIVPFLKTLAFFFGLAVMIGLAVTALAVGVTSAPKTTVGVLIILGLGWVSWWCRDMFY